MKATIPFTKNFSSSKFSIHPAVALTMVHNIREDDTAEICDKEQSGSASDTPILTEYRIVLPPLQEGLMQDEVHERRLLDFLKATPSITCLKNLNFCSPLQIFQRTVNGREEMSISVPSAAAVPRNFSIHFVRKINWTSLLKISKDWLRHPMNIALLIWLLSVAVSGSMLLLLLLGLLNKAFPTKPLRHHWIEINNQILNALFTLMSIYQHPNLFHHLVLLCRWHPDDMIELRKVYCKNGAYRPHERRHITVVVVLLHITCLSQYVLCSLYWGYSLKLRSEFAENFFFILGIAAPLFAGIYTNYSPLGREFDDVSDEEAKQYQKTGLKSYERRVIVSKPEWAGGLFDCSEDLTVCSLSSFCTCCVFGWNMERLGFGNMYVHIVTFLLLCVAPFWIFNISALNIRDYVLGDVIGVAGIVLCFFGLLYGGFWRIQMRKKFGLPRNKTCCCSASMTDYVQWMFCWPCALAQEVRTGNFYDVEDDSFYAKLLNDDLEDGSRLAAVSDSDSDLTVEARENGINLALDGAMTPPVQAVIQSDSSSGSKDKLAESANPHLKIETGDVSPTSETED